MAEDAGRVTRRRLTINQAADQLGVTVDAVRGRIKRGTIAHVRESGRVYVLLAADELRPGHDQDADHPDDRTDTLIAKLQDRVRSLEDANRENRRIIAALTSRISQLEAPQETPEAPEAVDEVPERAEPRSDAAGPQAATQPPQGGGPLSGPVRTRYTSRQQERTDERVLRAFRELADRDPTTPIGIHEVREIADVPGLSDELDRLQRKGYIAQLPDRPNWFAVTDEGYQAALEPREWWRRVFGG